MIMMKKQVQIKVKIKSVREKMKSIKEEIEGELMKYLECLGAPIRNVEKLTGIIYLFFTI